MQAIELGASQSLLWLPGGDFNIPLQDMKQWFAAMGLAGRIAASGADTCFTFGTSSKLDYYLLSPRLAQVAGQISTKTGTTLATHHPVDLELHLGCKDFYIDMLVRPPRPAHRPVFGPHMQEGGLLWETKWTAAWLASPYTSRARTLPPMR